MWFPWGYIMGPEPASTRRIPGLKIEIWGTRPISSENAGFNFSFNLQPRINYEGSSDFSLAGLPFRYGAIVANGVRRRLRCTP
jgi:hypothetical protein